MNSALYQKILNENIQLVCALKFKPTWVMQQDNDHTFKSTSEKQNHGFGLAWPKSVLRDVIEMI